MPYKQKLRELEPELYLIEAIYGEIPGFKTSLNLWGFYNSLSPEILDFLRTSELREKVLKTVSMLPEREQQVIHLRFGIQDGVRYTLNETAKSMPRVRDTVLQGTYYPSGEPVTKERVRQLEIRTLRKLRHPGRSRELQRYLESLSTELVEKGLYKVLNEDSNV